MSLAVKEAGSSSYGEFPPEWTREFDVAGNSIDVISAPDGETVFMGDAVEDAKELAERANLNVGSVVNFKGTLKWMIGEFADGENDQDVEFEFNVDDRDWLAENGIMVATTYEKEAIVIAEKTSGIAIDIIEGRSEIGGAASREYMRLMTHAYEITESLSPRNKNADPISVLRTGAITTRLAQGIEYSNDPESEWQQLVAREVNVVAKRAHPTAEFGHETDMLLLIKWQDDIRKLSGADIEISDLVLATGASVTATVLSAVGHGAKPRSVDFRHGIGTTAGAAYLSRAMNGLGIDASISMLAASTTMNEKYYLTHPYTVGDGGDILHRFLPEISAEASKR